MSVMVVTVLTYTDISDRSLSGAVTVVTAVTNFGRGSRPIVGIHVSLLWYVSVVWTEGGTADFW